MLSDVVEKQYMEMNKNISSEELYPMAFLENTKHLVWGTEEWAISAVSGSESVVANGKWKSDILDDVIARFPVEILGKHNAEKYNNQLPLLAKYIDAHADLSIQVHPNDEMAAREHGKMGKSEMWYILDAEPGAYLYAGFNRTISLEEYKERVENGTITDVLAKNYVRPGDFVYLPAGRVHAICGGIRLAEIQQSSDITYRIYDYGRPGLDGKPRQLHTEQASRALDYHKVQDECGPNGNMLKTGPDYKELCSPYFTVRALSVRGTVRRDMKECDSFVIVMALSGICTLRMCETGAEIRMQKDDSVLIPAAIADYELIADEGVEATVLESCVPL